MLEKYCSVTVRGSRHASLHTTTSETPTDPEERGPAVGPQKQTERRAAGRAVAGSAARRDAHNSLACTSTAHT